jgi:hypothetical protein
MHTGFAPAAYHEPDRLDPTRTVPTNHIPINCVKGPCCSWPWARLSWQFTLLQRLHNFTHRLVISSLAKRLKITILPNVHFLWCTVRRSPHSLSQRFPAHKIFTLRFHHCGSRILQRPPLVPSLGGKPTPSPKSRKSHPVLLPRISAKLGKEHVT